MREAREWDEAYLYSLPVGEFDWLEVKGRRGIDLTLLATNEQNLRDLLSKAISALANTGGGQLILGLSNPRGGGWQVDDGGIDLVMKKPSSKEWLEDVIPSLVDYPLTKFNVYQIEASDSTSPILPGRGIFIIDIPDSDQAPHQANDNRYYARVGGKSRPIGQRLVADIFGRRRDPQIELELFLVESSTYYDHSVMMTNSLEEWQAKARRHRVELKMWARNVGRVYAQYVTCRVSIPLSLVPNSEIELQLKRSTEIDGVLYEIWLDHNTKRDLIERKAERWQKPWLEEGPSRFHPILPGLTHLWSWKLRDDLVPADLETDARLIWQVFADNAPPRSGEIALRDIQFVSKEEPPAAPIPTTAP